MQAAHPNPLVYIHDRNCVYIQRTRLLTNRYRTRSNFQAVEFRCLRPGTRATGLMIQSHSEPVQFLQEKKRISCINPKTTEVYEKRAHDICLETHILNENVSTLMKANIVNSLLQIVTG